MLFLRPLPAGPEDFFCPGNIRLRPSLQQNQNGFQPRSVRRLAQEFNTLEKESSAVDSYFNGGIEHRLTSDLGLQKAVWQNGDFECCIQGYISKEEAISAIDSIY